MLHFHRSRIGKCPEGTHQFFIYSYESDGKYDVSLPEVDPDFDDSSFVSADLITTNVSDVILEGTAYESLCSIRICRRSQAIRFFMRNSMGMSVTLATRQR